MKTRNSWIFVLTALFCGALFCANAEARVCFASDPGCSGGADFGNNYNDDSENLCLSVKNPNTGGLMYSKRPCPQKTHIAAVCPYNGSYVQCCKNVYAYSACVYPLENAGKCGDSYKCVCSKAKFPFTAGQCYNNSIPGGTNCLQVDDDDKNMSIHYEKCVCDRSIFPYATNSDCGTNQIVDTNNPCKDSSGGTYYRKCTCPSGWNGCVTMGPAIGAKKCVIDGETNYSECCVCSAADGFGLNLSHEQALEYETCPCNGSYRKIKRCKPGYKPSGTLCIEMTCKDAVNAWLDASPSRKSSYTIMASSGDPSTSKIIVTENVKPMWMRQGKTYYGAAYLGRYVGDSNIQAKCKTTPIVDWSYSNLDSGSGSTYFYGMVLNFIGSTTSISSDFYGTNLTIKGSTTVNFNGWTSLSYNSSYYNPATDERLYVKLPQVNFNGYLSSTGVSYDVGHMGVYNSGSIYTPGTFKADSLNVWRENGIQYVSYLDLYDGDYYVVRAQIAHNRDSGRSFIRVRNGAKWYMYGDKSSRHEVSVGFCSGICVNSGGRIVHSGSIWQGNEPDRYRAYLSCSTHGDRNPRSTFNNEWEKYSDIRDVDWQYCNGSDRCKSSKGCW